MLSQGINFSPLGIAKKGLDYLGNMLPVNRRAIMENQLSGQGIMVNDIGQIVSDGGNINTAENIMAGYNASKIDADTFQKRRTMIEDNLKAGKYKDPKKMQEKLNAINAAEERILGTATTQTNKIFDFEEEEKKKKKKDTVVGRFITKKKETKAAKAAQAAAAAADETSVGNYPTGGSYNAPGGVTDSNYNQAANIAGGGGGDSARNSKGQTAREATYDNDKTTGTAQSYSQHYADGGRAGYFFGGRVNYKIGGVVHPDGRKGFFKGAQADTSKGESMSPGTDASGDFRGGDNDGGASDNPPVTVVNNNPIDISTLTKSVGDYEIPVGLEALMADKGRLQAVLNADNILDKNLGAEFTYDKGPFNIGAYADMDGNKSLNANYTRNNSNYSFDLNEDGGQLKFAKAFANGGLAGLL